ncbi:hypothetical protein, partial [Escherichia coli]|uniref:hypothetical protein n=2 Tax=Escherichia coli TaxID=562 RepID=UPI002E18BA23|nr:hypothetical protein [Escherichia coli]
HGDNICLRLFRMQVSSDNRTSRILFLIVEWWYWVFLREYKGESCCIEFDSICTETGIFMIIIKSRVDWSGAHYFFE